MKPRDRVALALDHREADRVPFDLGGTVVTTMVRPAYEALCAAVGLPDDEVALLSFAHQTVRMNGRLQEYLGVDFRGVWLRTPGGSTVRPASDGSFVDQWGVEYRPGVSSYHPVGHPLAKATTIGDLDLYRWPDPLDPGWLAGLRQEASDLYLHSPYALVADLQSYGGPMSRAWVLRGFDNFMVDLASDLDFAAALLDRILEFQIPLLGRALAEIGDLIQVVTLGDDLGVQNGPLMSPELYRRVLKPRHARLIAEVKRRTQAKIFFHSCGSCYQLIPDLIEIGVDILNPVQVAAAAMDTARLKREFGDVLTFWGGIDTQGVLSQGTPQEVEREVRRRLDDLARGGGYVLATVHNVQAEVPPANVVALFRAAAAWGRY